MRKLSPSKTSTPTRLPRGRETYQKRSVENNTFNTESPIIMRDEDSGDDCNDPIVSDPNPSRIVRNKHKRNLTSRNDVRIVKAILLFSLGCIIGYYTPAIEFGTSPESSVVKQFNLSHLRSKYSSIHPETVFDELESAVVMINGKGALQSYIFAYRGDADSRKTAYEVSREVATLAAEYLGNGTVFIISKSDYLDTNVQADYGQLLTKWRPTIEQQRVMLVPDLNAFPAHLAPVFHTLCDEATPYVEPSLYLHTVDLGNTQQPHRGPGKGYFTIVETRLRQSWTELSDEVFGPLLARIAGGSVFIVD